MTPGGLLRSAADLRREFDDAFGRPISGARDADVDLLLIEGPGGQVAVRVAEVGAVLRCPRIARLPSANPALLGLAGVRGALVTVFDMAMLLGAAARTEGGGWLLLAAADQSLALRFGGLTAYRRVEPEAFHGVAPREVVSVGGSDLSVASIPWLLAAIHRAAPAADHEG
jgi:hypothetical protein